MTLTRFSTRTSGDLTADRRYAYGDAALADADFIAARDLFAQTLELVPGWPPAHFALAKASLALGEVDAASQSLQRVTTLDPEDRLGASVLLAQLTGGTAMPDAYVAGLFDDYADRFDNHLVDALNYRAPRMLAEVLQSERPGTVRFRRALDLGCGTGLMARALVGICPDLTGVDLSSGMLKAAAASGLYRRLACAELLAFLRTESSASYDLVLAADVFCYVPDLEPVFVEVERVLQRSGMFAFSIQTHAGDGVIIGADSRVHHAPQQIHRWADTAGLSLLQDVAASTREDRGVPVAGALFQLMKA